MQCRNYGNYVEVEAPFYVRILAFEFIGMKNFLQTLWRSWIEKKINLFEEKISLFSGEFPSINSRVELLFSLWLQSLLLFPISCGARGFFCLSVWCMRRDRKVSCAPFCLHASAICRTLSQLIEITVKIIAQHHKFLVCLASPVQIQSFPFSENN